jgi:DNA mismatch repair protein MutL
MLRDDALLAFERHATSKIRNADDLVNIATLGFRGEALPSIASVSRLRLETHASEDAAGTVVEIAGGNILTVEEAGLPLGTSISVRDLFFNIPARRKFLKAEPTELSHIASLVTHYALAHPEMHWELHSATNAMLIAPPVANHSERIYQVFGKETLDQLIPLSAILPLVHSGLPQPPPWRRKQEDDDEAITEVATPGEVRLHGFVSRPEIQKLNRNSIFIFVNGRLIRDRVVQHALTEAYRNIIPPTVYPVVLLFLEMPFTEVDVNVHPSKTEVRFRQSSFLHDFIRDSVRAALMKARPVPAFAAEIHAQPSASPSLSPSRSQLAEDTALQIGEADAAFALREPDLLPLPQKLQFGNDGISVDANATVPVARFGPQTFAKAAPDADITVRDTGCAPVLADEDAPVSLESLVTLKPIGQIRDSFILAVNPQGLWIIDQHVAHERVLFERILKQRLADTPERQQLLMPLLVELTPSQMAVFADISDELNHNGFEVEPFGVRTIAVKTTAAGVTAAQIEHLLHEILEQFEREEQSLNLDKIRTGIAASIACHAAIKVNMPLEQNKMEWLLQELAKTEYPMSCPHGRPIVLRYSVRDIQRAFKRI